MTLDDVADQLYGLDPGEFVEARKARVAAAKQDGDRDLATAIGKLRKPTTVGWLVNLLARQLPHEIDSLLALGEALRDAQRHLSGPDLRSLTTQRQQVVRALSLRAGELAGDRGRSVGEDALRDVGQTLHAALADPDTADQVRRGRVVAAANYSGFGPAGLAVVRGSSKTAPKAPLEKSKKTRKDEPTESDSQRNERKRTNALAAAEAELKEATSAEKETRRAFEGVHEQLQSARSTLTDIDDRIEQLRQELEYAEQERQFTRNTEKSAAEAAHRLGRELDLAERRVEEARQALDDLG